MFRNFLDVTKTTLKFNLDTTYITSVLMLEKLSRGKYWTFLTGKTRLEQDKPRSFLRSTIPSQTASWSNRTPPQFTQFCLREICAPRNYMRVCALYKLSIAQEAWLTKFHDISWKFPSQKDPLHSNTLLLLWKQSKRFFFFSFFITLYM